MPILRTLCHNIVFLLLMVFGSSLVHSEGFVDPYGEQRNITYLGPSDLASLTGDENAEALIDRFGPPLLADTLPDGWPKAKHKDTADQTVQWKKAYWFFYNKSGLNYVGRERGLWFVASLGDEVTDVSDPLIDLFGKMTIDWPPNLQGKRLGDYLTEVESAYQKEHEKH